MAKYFAKHCLIVWCRYNTRSTAKKNMSLYPQHPEQCALEMVGVKVSCEQCELDPRRHEQWCLWRLSKKVEWSRLFSFLCYAQRLLAGWSLDITLISVHHISLVSQSKRATALSLVGLRHAGPMGGRLRWRRKIAPSKWRERKEPRPPLPPPPKGRAGEGAHRLSSIAERMLADI